MVGSHGGPNTVTPCAACKLLRRRCARDCPFFPYFSPQEPQKFASVHKIFGASNVSKMLSEVPESQRADTVDSLVYEANSRIRDPVYGCMGTISALQQETQCLQAELAAVRAELMRYRHCDRAMATAASAANRDISLAGVRVRRLIPNTTQETEISPPADMLLPTRNSSFGNPSAAGTVQEYHWRAFTQNTIHNEKLLESSKHLNKSMHL